MTHKQLVDAAYRWVLGQSCGFAFRELRTIQSECPDVIGFGAWRHSVLVECKVSRADFHADKKKSFRLNPETGAGRYRFYCCPTGLLTVGDLPDGWGLVYVNAKGSARCVFNPYNNRGGNIWADGFTPNAEAERAYLYSALRRLHLRGVIDEIYTPIITSGINPIFGNNPLF